MSRRFGVALTLSASLVAAVSGCVTYPGISSLTARHCIADFRAGTDYFPDKQLVTLAASVVVLTLLGLALGPVRVPLLDTARVLVGAQASDPHWQVFMHGMRLPRVLTAIAAGAGLGVAGLQMQTLLRNTLADPYVLGVSSGAGLGVAVVVIATGSGAGFTAGLATATFAVRGSAGRRARIAAPEGLRAAVQRLLAREGWTVGEPAELVVIADDADRIAARASGFGESAPLGGLPELVRGIEPDTARCAPAAAAAAALAELADINPYFAISTGPVDNGWRPVQQLYSDRELLGDIVERVQARLNAAESRVAASIFFLGFAARLWSIGIGAVAGHRLLPALGPEELLFREFGGQIALHIARPTAWQGDGLQSRLADTILDVHLASLSAALQQLTNVSPEMLRGNAASALLGAAREYDRHQGAASPGPGWQLARGLCVDERLVSTVCFSGDDYRRKSCCLYYRTPRGGLCGDCVFTKIPGTPGRKDAS